VLRRFIRLATSGAIGGRIMQVETCLHFRISFLPNFVVVKEMKWGGISFKEMKLL
jgi:hypothetical protein